MVPRASYEWYKAMEDRTRAKLEQMNGDAKPEAEFYRRALAFALGEGDGMTTLAEWLRNPAHPNTCR